MNTRTILILALILAVLGVGLWSHKALLRSRNLSTAITLHYFATQDLMNATALELIGPDKTTVRLNKTNTGWVVSTLDQAPANEAVITHFLQTLNTLRGELRASDPTVLHNFQLEEAQATRLHVYQGPQEIFDLYLGKGDFRAMFVRQKNSDAVYVAPGTLTTQAGLRGQNPNSQFWINTHLFSVDPAEVHELVLTTPESRAKLYRQDLSSENATQTMAWSFEQSTGENLTQEHLEDILSVLKRVTVAEVLAADDPRQADLDDAPYVLTIQTKDKPIIVQAIRPDSQGDAVVRLDKAAHSYTMRGVVFERLFPEPKTAAADD